MSQHHLKSHDIHELLKHESRETSDSHLGKSISHAKDSYGISDHYVTLDTFTKLQDSNIDRGEFKWNFMIQGVTTDDSIGIRDKIDTVVEIQIGSFSIPILEEVPYILAAAPAAPTGTNSLVLIQNNNNVVSLPPTLIIDAGANGQYPQSLLQPGQSSLVPWIYNPYTQVPYSNFFTIQIQEAGHQSYSDRNGARHHFSFAISSPTTARSPNILVAFPRNGFKWDTFVFTDPLKHIHGITLVFRNPDIPIHFMPDCIYDAIIEVDGAVAPGPFLRITTPSNHLLRVGDRIFISKCNSKNQTLDRYVNRVEGHVCSGNPAAAPLTPATLIPGTTFWTDPAISTFDLILAVGALPQRIVVYIAKRRMRIPMRFRTIVSRRTNFISP